jgi:site-specific DNA-cytosine methylase
MKASDVPFIPDVVWASPDCTTYSIAAISTHRNGVESKSDYAKKCDAVNMHFISLIKQYLEVNPDMVFFIENPRGMLRKMPFMQEFTRHTV